MFVHEKVYDEFISRSVQLAKARKVGDPFATDTDQGPQVDNDQFKKIMHYIEIGKN